MKKEKTVVIVGAGASGIFASYFLLKHGVKVQIFDSNPSLGRKLLVAGKGGLNLSHSENLELFSNKYGVNKDRFKGILKEFGAEKLKAWCDELGVETFTGSSGRIFPKSFNAAEFLLKIKEKLENNSHFKFYPKHRLMDVSYEKNLTFETANGEKKVQNDIVILALGGASWKKTGSDGKWKNIIEKLGLRVTPFLPMNCGFERKWSEYFLGKCERLPVKNIGILIEEKYLKGELMITSFGVEGGAIYAVSSEIRNSIRDRGFSEVEVDLKPKMSEKEVFLKLQERRQGESLKNLLRKKVKLEGAAYELLLELSDRDQMNDLSYLSSQIKKLKMKLSGVRPIDEAISTSGGVSFSNLDENFEATKVSGLFFAGEMLDFETVTGGYLLQACFSTSFRIVQRIIKLKAMH